MSGATRLVRLHLPVLVLAAVPVALALRFGGYHIRHGGWAALVLVAWACIQAAQGRLSAPRSLGGVATIAMLGLVVWSALSMTWADASVHEAWVETARAAGYAAAFVLGGALLASARSFARFAAAVGAMTVLLGLATLVRLLGDAPLRAFVAGRLDWPVGYAPGLAAAYLLAMLLLVGVSSSQEARWAATGARRHLTASALATGGSTVALCLALLAQSRGTIPALAVALIVALVAAPHRLPWLARFALLGVAALAAARSLGAAFRTQFELRQAPFTPGADEDALFAAAESAARDAAVTTLLVALAAVLVGAALVPASTWATRSLAAWEARSGVRLALPATVLVVALAGSLLVLGADEGRSPTRWLAQQWEACIDPPERTNDPGSATSHFANTGTGRCDYYRVALQSVGERPVTGLGAGNFRGEYVRERRTLEEPRVVHSLPLQLLAELGVVGALLGGVVLGCVVWAAVLYVRSGRARDPAFAGAIAALAYWTAHSSIDWLWQLPAVTLPAIALAGGLVACVSPGQRRVRSAVAAPIASGVLLGCIALILPVTMADARLRQARDPQLRKEDPNAALDAARDAQAFDPTWAEPALVAGALHAAAGRREHAADAARRAVRLEPRSWSVQLRASGLIGLDDTQEGRRAFLAARRLNPALPASVPRPTRPAGGDPDALQEQQP